MEPQPGKSSDVAFHADGALRTLTALGRMVGFCLLVVPALATIGAIVLLPAYAGLAQAQHERRCEQADIADMRALNGVYDRMLSEGPESESFTKRLMLTQTSRVPENEIVINTGVRPGPPPGVVAPKRTSRPPAPDDWAIRLAGRIQDDRTRRGLLFVSIGAIVAAMFLFSAPDKYRYKPLL